MRFIASLRSALNLLFFWPETRVELRALTFSRNTSQKKPLCIFVPLCHFEWFDEKSAC